MLQTFYAQRQRLGGPWCLNHLQSWSLIEVPLVAAGAIFRDPRKPVGDPSAASCLISKRGRSAQLASLGKLCTSSMRAPCCTQGSIRHRRTPAYRRAHALGPLAERRTPHMVR